MGAKARFLTSAVYTLDTNAIIYYLTGDKRAIPRLREILFRNAPLYISAITELELFSFSKLSQKDTALIEDLLSTLAIIPVDSRIARTAAELRRTYGIKLADSVIAATALYTGTTLVTRNARDFRSVQELDVVAI